MAANSSTLNVWQPQIPVFKGDSYELWSIKMKTLFKSEDLLDFVETDCSEAINDEIRQKDTQKQDAKALFFIQQAVDESIFSKIALATSAKQAWSLLKTEYQRSTKELKPTFPIANTIVGVGDVAITIQILQSLLDCVEKEKKQTNQILPSIYMAPSTLRDRNPSSFKPRVVSIGPLHRKDENLKASEGSKANHMFNLLSRLDSTKEKTLEICVQKVNDSMDRIRSSYAETMIYTNVELAKMMVLDGCFILEFLYTLFKEEISSWGNVLRVQCIIYDLVLLENQIPFLVLEKIFECTISKFDTTVSLIKLIYLGLESVNLFKEHKFIRNIGSNSNFTHHHHILGLLHESYHYKDAKSSEFSSSKIHSAIELDRAGVNFKPIRDTEWPMVMEVKSRRLPCFSCSWGKPTLIMPILDINDFTELVLRNLIAYEQCTENVLQYVTSYAMAMDMLIDSQDDITKLVESKVIVNHIGSNQEAADMINSICKEVVWRDFFYYMQWIELDRHYNGYWSRNVAWLRRTYFNNPWNIVALLAGIFLFVLTVIQTVFAVNPAGSN